MGICSSPADLKFHTSRMATLNLMQTGKARTDFSNRRPHPEFPPTENTERIDLNVANSSWDPGGAMYFKRYFATSVLMPDGQVFISGGSSCPGTNNIRSPDLNTCSGGAIMNPEIYNPVTNSWNIMARQQVIRMYHSVALLLPDARILVAGGGRSGAFGENGILNEDIYLAHREVEIFSPPCLFDSNGSVATRPVITSPNTISTPFSISYGQVFPVGIGGVPASQIAKVVLVRLPSVTHTLNFDQRRVVLPSPVVQGSQTISVTAPPSGNDCPPGPYMMFFVIDTNGVPSEAGMVLVNCNPLAPSGLVATAISSSQVNIRLDGCGRAGGSIRLVPEEKHLGAIRQDS